MAKKLKRKMKFKDLSDDLKLLVTKWLPKRLKIALVDVFPPVLCQIKSVSIDDLTSNNYLMSPTKQAVELYRKLTSVTKITAAKPIIVSHKLFHAIVSNLRPDIEYCSIFEYDFQLKYILMLHQKYPDFDGSRIKNTFYILSNTYIPNILKKFPNLNLNLHLNLDTYTHLIEDVIIRKHVKSLSVGGFILQQWLSNPLKYRSMEKLVISCGAPFLIQNIEKIRSANPRIKDLTVNIENPETWNTVCAIDFTNCILSIEHLKSLKVVCRCIKWGNWHDRDREDILAYYSMVTVLLATEKKTLTHLDISFGFKRSQTMSIQLWNNIRKGFKFFKISNRITREIFEVDGDIMKIRVYGPNLIDVFNNFPRVTHIQVETKNELKKQRLNDELQVIRSEIPRNRWVNLEFGRIDCQVTPCGPLFGMFM